MVCCRVPFRGLFIRVPYYVDELKRNPNSEYCTFKVEGVVNWISALWAACVTRNSIPTRKQ